MTSGFLCLLPPPLVASVSTGLLAAISSAGGTEQVSSYLPGSYGLEEGMRGPGLGGTLRPRWLWAWASLDAFRPCVACLCMGTQRCLTSAYELLGNLMEPKGTGRPWNMGRAGDAHGLGEALFL